MTAPEISIVIPTHGGRYLRATVESVIAQTFGDWELVIVDDGSRDGTAAIAAGLARADGRIRVVTQENAGIAMARNRGLRAISGLSTYVAFLDHDDLWTPRALELLRAELGARPSASAAHGLVAGVDEDGQPMTVEGNDGFQRLGIDGGRLVEWPPDRPTEFANLVYDDCVVSLGSGLIRRSVLDRIGALDPLAEPADDYDLWLRLARRGEIGFVREVVLVYRVHGARTSLRPAPPRGRGTPYVRYKLIASPENTPEQRALAVTGFRAYQGTLLEKRWSELRVALRERSYRRVPAKLRDVALRLAAYLRGRPYSWHR